QPSCLPCFFFSSRRPHTRFSRDWSSDVCSSDLHSLSMDRVAPDFLFNDSRALAQLSGDKRQINLLGRPSRKLCRQSMVCFIGFRSEERRVGTDCTSRSAPS